MSAIIALTALAVIAGLTLGWAELQRWRSERAQQKQLERWCAAQDRSRQRKAIGEYTKRMQ